MPTLPDFTGDQRSELLRLGLCKEQVEELRRALVAVRSYVSPPAANNDTADLLREIEQLASDLARKLRALSNVADSAHHKAGSMIEEGYWTWRPEDDGATVPNLLCPRLDALTIAASEAGSSLPKGKAVRPTAGNPAPIRSIERALVRGWSKAHDPVVSNRTDPEGGDEVTLSAMVEEAKRDSLGKPYPRKLLPSVSVTSAFHQIVGICYAAGGYTAFPKRALQEYVANRNRTRKEIIALWPDCGASEE
ncbi:MAG TPA: hypothetical protein VIT66_00520 [Lysobacter sp.]